MSYTPRTTQPADDDLRFRSNDGLAGSNGYNNFPNVRARWGGLSPYLGSVLANCTGYCQGRWMELGNTNTPYAFHGNAGEWINEAIQAGYATGSEPQLGAIVVFAGWSTNKAGHVAIVEEISDDGSYIKCSESNYGSTIFEWPVYRYRDTGWKRKGSSSGSSIGFVYHPNIAPPEPTYTLTVVNGSASSYSGKNGDRVVIDAVIPSGYRFNRWVISGKGSIDYIDQSHTTFQFGDGDCTIEATFIKITNGMNFIYYMSPPIYRRN